MIRKKLFKVMIVAAAAVMTTFSGFAQNPTDAEVLKVRTHLELKFAITAAGTPTYSLNYGGKAVILPSELGYEIRGKRLKGTF